MKTANRAISSIFNTASPAETMRLAAAFARRLRGGEIIFLRGPIGAGKTVFVQGLAKALGMKAAPISASFTLMREYRSAKARLFHIDLFRLAPKDIANLGLETLLEVESAVIAAEWPDASGEFFPPDRLELEFALTGADGRKITAAAHGPSSRKLLK